LRPEEVLRLPAELARVDGLLDDPAFFAPFVPHFEPLIGRPCTPVECYLRLMFLKFRYRLGYESLCAEVSDSITWRRFCRIPLDGKVPHPTTLMKLTARCGEEAVAGLNEALWAKAAGAKLLRTARVRADTTVIGANVAYPTDSGAVGQGGGQAGAHGAAGAGPAGGATGTAIADRRRAAARRVRAIAAKLRTRAKLGREESTAAIARVTGELADLAEKTAAEAAAVLRNGRRALPKALSGRARGRLRRGRGGPGGRGGGGAAPRGPGPGPPGGRPPAAATGRASGQARAAGRTRKARIDRRVEFGYKAQVAGNDGGIILDYSVELGAAPDGPPLAPAVERVSRRAGRPPAAVTADRGYGQPSVERDLHELGVRTVAIPRQATTSAARKAIEHSRSFHRLVKWRTGSEGRISYLKRGYGWDRTRLDGKQGAAIWCGHGVFAHNLVKIGALAG